MAIPKSALKFYTLEVGGTEVTGGAATAGRSIHARLTYPFQETITNETINSPFTGRLDLSTNYDFDSVAEDPLDPEIDVLNATLEGRGILANLFSIAWSGAGIATINGNSITVPSGAGNLTVTCKGNTPYLKVYHSDNSVTLDSEVDLDTGHTINALGQEVSIATITGFDIGAVRQYAFSSLLTIPANSGSNQITRGTFTCYSGQQAFLNVNIYQSAP